MAGSKGGICRRSGSGLTGPGLSEAPNDRRFSKSLAVKAKPPVAITEDTDIYTVVNSIPSTTGDYETVTA